MQYMATKFGNLKILWIKPVDSVIRLTQGGHCFSLYVTNDEAFIAWYIYIVYVSATNIQQNFVWIVVCLYITNDEAFIAWYIYVVYVSATNIQQKFA